VGLDYNKEPEKVRTRDFYEGDNPYGIAELRLDMCATDIPEPIAQWGTIPRAWKITGGTYQFYARDSVMNRFAGHCFSHSMRCAPACPDSAWDSYKAIRNSKCAVAVEPNYVVAPSELMPRWMAIQAIARKRWVGRQFQEMGIKVIADLDVHPDYWGLAFQGIPVGYGAYSVRYHADMQRPRVLEIFEQCQEHAQSEDVLFCVFGGDKVIRKFCETQGFFWHRAGRLTENQRKALCPIEE